jgi:hypothetical protein
MPGTCVAGAALAVVLDGGAPPARRAKRARRERVAVADAVGVCRGGVGGARSADAGVRGAARAAVGARRRDAGARDVERRRDARADVNDALLVDDEAAAGVDDDLERAHNRVGERKSAVELPVDFVVGDVVGAHADGDERDVADLLGELGGEHERRGGARRRLAARRNAQLARAAAIEIDRADAARQLVAATGAAEHLNLVDARLGAGAVIERDATTAARTASGGTALGLDSEAGAGRETLGSLDKNAATRATTTSLSAVGTVGEQLGIDGDLGRSEAHKTAAIAGRVSTSAATTLASRIDVDRVAVKAVCHVPT